MIFLKKSLLFSNPCSNAVKHLCNNTLIIWQHKAEREVKMEDTHLKREAKLQFEKLAAQVELETLQ